MPSPATVLICSKLSTRQLTSPESLWNQVISGAEVRILEHWDQFLTDTALNVTLRALFAVARIITPHRFGTYGRESRRVKRNLAIYALAMLNTTHDTPTCSPVDDGSRDSQLNRSCALGSIPALRIRLPRIQKRQDTSSSEEQDTFRDYTVTPMARDITMQPQLFPCVLSSGGRTPCSMEQHSESFGQGIKQEKHQMYRRTYEM